MEVDGSRCLRKEYDKDGGSAWLVSFQYMDQAKEACANKKRCVGIEESTDSAWSGPFWSICLDSIYTSTAYDKYEHLTKRLLKKVKGYCKFINPMHPNTLTEKDFIIEHYRI